MNNILVTGATGHLGKAVVKHLLNKTDGSSVKVLVRDAAKVADLAAKGVEVHNGDYSEREALLKAFKGIDKLYLVSGTDLHNRAAQQKNVIEAAKAAGIKHIVYTSFQRTVERADSPIAAVSQSHLATENALKASGLTYIILQDGLYADMIPMYAGENVVAQNAINFPAGDGKTAFALRDDMAEASANILLDDTGKYNNRSILITGSEAVTWADIANYITEITGEKIVYSSPDAEGYRSALKAAHLPEEIVGILVGFGEAIKQGEFEEVSPALEEILGRKPVTVKDYLIQVYSK